MACYIKHVPTVLSLSQLLEENESPGMMCSPEEPISACHLCVVPSISYPFSEGTHPNKTRSFGALSAASIAGSSQRLWKSMHGPGSPSASDESTDTDDYSDGTPSRASLDMANYPAVQAARATLVDKVLIKEWDDRFLKGLFRYDVTECVTKVTSGVYGFIAQLNEGRASKKRATEFRVDQVCQPFEANKFNFTKAAMKEVLFQFSAGAVERTRYHPGKLCGASPNLVLINVSPIEYGHVLLVPRVNDCIPQLVDQTTMLFALQFASEVHNPYFRLGYNSLGAFGTINHLHFQGYYMQMPYPVERAPTVSIPGFPERVRGVRVQRLEAYPVEGWVFEGATNQDSLASLVGALCMKLQTLNVPHNLLICDMGARVIMWPQVFAQRQAQGLVPEELLEMGVNPAAFEIAGHMVLKRKEDYDALTQDIAWKLLEEVSFSPEAMAALQAQIFAGFV